MINPTTIPATLRKLNLLNARRKALNEAFILLNNLADHLYEAEKDFGNVTNSFQFALDELGNTRQELEGEEEELDWEDVA